MALVLAGYRADEAGLTGTNWLKNTLSYATTVGMTKDVKSAIASGCARQDAAQILANTLTEVDAVVWSEFVSDFVYDGVDGLASGNKQTVGAKWMDLITYEGVLVGSGDAGSTKGHMDVQVERINDVEVAANYNGGAAKSFETDNNYVDLLGEYVKVVTGEKGDVVGVYSMDSENIVINTIVNKVSYDSVNKIKADGTVYKVDNTAPIVGQDGNVIGGVYNNTILTTFTAGNKSTVSGDQIKLVDNDQDGTLDIAIVIPAKVSEVTFANDTNYTLASLAAKGVNGNLTNAVSYKMEDSEVADEFAADDYVAITNNFFTDKHVVTKLEVVEGTVDSIKNEASQDAEFKINDTWYPIVEGRDTAGEQPTIGSDIKAYIYNGVMYDYDLTKLGYNDFVYVSGFANSTNAAGEVQAKATFGDGESKLIYVDGIIDSDTALDDDTIGAMIPTEIAAHAGNYANKLYAYTQDGDTYRLREIDPTDTTLSHGVDAPYDGAFGGLYYDDQRLVSDGGSRVYLTDEASVFVVYDGGSKVSVVSGATVKGWGDKTYNAVKDGVAITRTSNGMNNAVVAMVNIGGTSYVPGSDTNFYGYVTEVTQRTSNKDYLVKVWNGSEQIEYTTTTTNIKKGDVIEYVVTSDNEIDVETNHGGSTALGNAYAVSGAQLDANNQGWISFSGSATTYRIDDDTKILFVDSWDPASTADTTGKISKADNDPISGNTYANVLTNLTGLAANDPLPFIVVDIHNNWNEADLETVVAAQSVVDNAALQALFNTGASEVTITNTTLDTLKVPTGKTLNLANNLTVTNDITIAGTIDTDTYTLTASAGKDVTLQNATIEGFVDAGESTVDTILVGTVTVKGKLEVAQNKYSTTSAATLNIESGATFDDNASNPVPANVTLNIKAGADVYQGVTKWIGNTGANLKLTGGTLSIAQNVAGASCFTLKSGATLTVNNTQALLTKMTAIIESGAVFDTTTANYTGADNTNTITVKTGGTVKLDGGSNFYDTTPAQITIDFTAAADTTFKWDGSDSWDQQA